jgi:hypothetical protein
MIESNSMSQEDIIAVTEIAIARKQRIAFLGSLLLFVGVFLPLVSTPLGSVNYFDNGQGDGAIVLALAVISIILALTRSFGWLLISGLCSVGLPVYYLVTILKGLSHVRENMQTELADNPFKGIADLAINSVQIQWGWAILILGGVTVIVAAALPPQYVQITTLGRMFGKAMTVLSAAYCVMLLLGYFGITDNWLYRHSAFSGKLSRQASNKESAAPDTKSLPLVAQPGQCLPYSPISSTLTGTLVETDAYWVLNLRQPICTVQGSKGQDAAVRDVLIVQLFFTDESQKYRSLLGTTVKATGTLFSPWASNHHTPVLLQVSGMEPTQ